MVSRNSKDTSIVKTPVVAQFEDTVILSKVEGPRDRARRLELRKEFS